LSFQHGSNTGAIEHRSRPIEAIGRLALGQQRVVQLVPDARLLPIPQATPACHAAAEADLLRNHRPGNAGSQHEQNASQRFAIAHRRSPPLGDRSITGNSGSTTSHSSSKTNGFAMTVLFERLS
jgi:hypothetical protein